MTDRPTCLCVPHPTNGMVMMTKLVSNDLAMPQPGLPFGTVRWSGRRRGSADNRKRATIFSLSQIISGSGTEGRWEGGVSEIVLFVVT